MSLLDAYRSDKAILRRQGQGNVRFRPLMHLNGQDDWVGHYEGAVYKEDGFQRKQLGVEELTDQIMDENGIVYDLNPTANDRLSTFFTNFNPHVRLG